MSKRLGGDAKKFKIKRSREHQQRAEWIRKNSGAMRLRFSTAEDAQAASMVPSRKQGPVSAEVAGLQKKMDAVDTDPWMTAGEKADRLAELQRHMAAAKAKSDSAQNEKKKVKNLGLNLVGLQEKISRLEVILGNADSYDDELVSTVREKVIKLQALAKEISTKIAMLMKDG